MDFEDDHVNKSQVGDIAKDKPEIPHLKKLRNPTETKLDNVKQVIKKDSKCKFS